MFAVNFTGARWSRGARYGVKKVPGFSKGLHNGGLSRARRSGNDKENSVSAESHHIVILSEAKNLRLLLSRRPQARSQGCFASLNMTKTTLALIDRDWLCCGIRVHLDQIGYSRF
jgi:hypothetical protein